MPKADLSTVKLIWTFSTLVGVAFTALHWRNAHNDREAIKQVLDFVEDGPRDIVSKANEQQGRLWFFAETMFFIGGVISIFMPPPSSDYRLPRIRGGAAIVCLVSAQLGIVTNILILRQARKAVMSLPIHHKRRAMDRKAS